LENHKVLCYTIGMDTLLQSLFAVCEEFGASDIHLAADIVPRFRIRGSLVEKGGYRSFGMKAVDEIAMELGLLTLPLGCPEGTEKVRQILLRNGSLDGAVTVPSCVRYRFTLPPVSGEAGTFGGAGERQCVCRGLCG